MTHAMTDLRERITKAIGELEAKADGLAREGKSPEWHISLRGKIQGLKLVLDYMRVYEPPYGTVEDGFGSVWQRCKEDCRLEVVRPGKVQCECDG